MDKLVLEIKEILKSTQDNSIKNLVEEKCKDILGEKRVNDATVYNAINNALIKLYKSDTYILHDLLDLYFKNDANKDMYKNNIDYLLGQAEGKRNDKSIVLTKNAVLENQDGDTPLLYALKVKDASNLVKDFSSLLTKEVAKQRKTNTHYTKHIN